MFLFLVLFLFNNIPASAVNISDIEIKGNREIPNVVILNYLTFEKNSEFKLDLLAQSYTNLKNSGYVSNLTMYPQIADGKLSVIIDLTEVDEITTLLKKDEISTLSELKTKKIYPIISKISFEGNYNIEDTVVSQLTNLKIGGLYSLDRLEMAKNNLENSGLFQKVYYTSEKIGENVEVVFHFAENIFIGNEIKFEGNTLITTDELKKIVSTKTDTIMNKNDVIKDITSIQKLYAKYDYLGISVNIRTVSGNLVFVINEPIIGDIIFRKQNHLGKIEPLYTQDYVLRRHIAIKSGEILRKSDIDNTIRDLNRLGYFKNIVPDIIDSKNSNRKDIIFNLDEEFGIKANLSCAGKLDGTINFNALFENNNFLGREYHFNVSLDYDLQKRWKGRLYFFDPWIKGTYGLSYGVELYRSHEDSKKDYGYFNNSTSTGIELTLGSNIFSKDYKVALKNDFKLTEQYDENYNLWDLYLENVTSLIFSINKLNNYLDPTNGYFGNITLSYTAPIPKWGVKYTDFENKPHIFAVELQNKFYLAFPLEINTIAARFSIGYSKFISKHENIHFGGYNLGGQFSVRGYDIEAGKGNLYTLLNLENRITLYDKEIKLELALFFDIGIAVYEDELNDLGNWKNYLKSTGICFRLKKFFLPISFSLVLPFHDAELQIRPEINFGYTF